MYTQAKREQGKMCSMLCPIVLVMGNKGQILASMDKYRETINIEGRLEKSK